MKALARICIGAAAIVGFGAGASARDFAQITGKAADGTRFYEDSIEIEAPAADLWRAFTDQAAYRNWAAPVSAIDFRIGGSIEASYDEHGKIGDPQNIRQMIVAYIPGRLLVFRNVQAPAGLPRGEVYGQTVKTLEFTRLAPGRTRVTIAGMGFAEGAAFDRLYGFFSVGDGEMLVGLKHAYERRSH